MGTVVKKVQGGARADAAVQRLVEAGFSADHISIEGPYGAPAPPSHDQPRLWGLIGSRMKIQAAAGAVIGLVIGIVIVAITGRRFSFPGHSMASAGVTILAAMVVCALVLTLAPLPSMIDIAEDPERRALRHAPGLQAGDVTVVVDAGEREALARSILEERGRVPHA